MAAAAAAVCHAATTAAAAAGNDQQALVSQWATVTGAPTAGLAALLPLRDWTATAPHHTRLFRHSICSCTVDLAATTARLLPGCLFMAA